MFSLAPGGEVLTANNGEVYTPMLNCFFLIVSEKKRVRKNSILTILELKTKRIGEFILVICILYYCILLFVNFYWTAV